MITPQEVEQYFQLMKTYQVSELDIPGVVSIKKPLHLPPEAVAGAPDVPADEQDWMNFKSATPDEQERILKNRLGTTY